MYNFPFTNTYVLHSMYSPTNSVMQVLDDDKLY